MIGSIKLAGHLPGLSAFVSDCFMSGRLELWKDCSSSKRGSRSTSRVVDRLHVCVLVTRISPCAFIEALFIRSAPLKGAATTLGGGRCRVLRQKDGASASG